ncbi:hypothetical protein KM043_000008, partial [Ampulex compressa]
REGGPGLLGDWEVVLIFVLDQGKESGKGNDLGNRPGGDQDQQGHWEALLG